ncbi:hypothetical protein ID856_05595 [Xenorhabdus sp. 18]|uniref:DUF6387 family protein n=1 Tax=Xenorhabdus doucetiae TaxID=351671 RepID=UPI0019901156|nr:DUF6387 family protein [Xenorhabdus sp. 18]MBD2796012.1 hypothetical protein [Xenorhabdus sp. 18]
MRISKKSDLPKWFNIKNYERIKDLPDDEIAYLITCRINDLMTERFKGKNYFENHVYYGDDFWNCTPEITPIKTKNRISSSSSVTPLTINDINTFRNDLLDIGIDLNSNDEKGNHISAYEHFGMSITSWHGVVCSINLLTSQDETIISDLRVLLKKWRAELDFEEKPSLISSSWEVIKPKIINYNIFAFLDLQLWQLATGNSITSGVLSVTLYPEGEYDSIQISQTIKPFSEKLFTSETLEKIEREISHK